MSGQPPADQSPGLSPLPLSVRQRLQAVFEHAQRSVEKSDHDYAYDLLTQCVVEDPGNLIYLQHFLANLAKKYGANKKGAKFSALKIKGARSTLIKATGKGRWQQAFQAACEALKCNPWDTPTLVALAEACQELGCDESQLFLLRWAMDVDPKDPVVNRHAARTLARLGQFDPAIGCWRRVEKAKPGDEEATKEISRLSVEKTIHQGGYNQEMLSGEKGLIGGLEATLRANSKQANLDRGLLPTPAGSAAVQPPDDQDPQQLLDAIDADPAQLSNYLDLANLYSHDQRFREAEQVLTRAMRISGGGLKVRELLEDAQLRRVHQQVEIASRRAQEDRTEEAVALARRMEAQANQAELEVYAARVDREPGKVMLQYELGLRLKRAGKFKEAIQAFQAAREDVSRQAIVQLHLGECFQYIRQFKLAATSYQGAVEAAESLEPDTKKLALYRAGTLAFELREWDRAEKYLTDLAAIDFGYRDVAERLDKLPTLRDNG